MKGLVYPGAAGNGHVCGDADIWTNGGTIDQLGTPATDERGVPLCCDRADGNSSGGAAYGGQVREGAPRLRDMLRGGLKFGGMVQAEAYLVAEYTVGGLGVGGISADVAPAPHEPTGGGLAVGGQFVTEASLAAEHTGGGYRFGGQVAEASHAAEETGGGYRVGGQVAEASHAAEETGGGYRVGGQVGEGSSGAEHTGGGIKVGGFCPEPPLFPEYTQGGISFGGSHTEAAKLSDAGAGGYRLGGQVTESQHMLGELLAYSFVATDEFTTAATPPTALPTLDSVTFNLAAATTIIVEFEAEAYCTGSAFIHSCFIFVDGVQQNYQTSYGTASNAPFITGVRDTFALAAGNHTVQIKYSSSGGAQAHSVNRLLKVTRGS